MKTGFCLDKWVNGRKGKTLRKLSGKGLLPGDHSLDAGRPGSTMAANTFEAEAPHRTSRWLQPMVLYHLSGNIDS